MNTHKTLLVMNALSALAASGALDVRGGEVPLRNYDIQGPKPVAGPPTAVEGTILTRQQRRKLDRQNKKQR